MTKTTEIVKSTVRPSLFTKIDPDIRVSEKERIHMISVDRIFPNPSQPRKTLDDDSLFRLADSIRRFGILQPITVRQTDTGVFEECTFEIVAGERRFKAAQLLGLNVIPCIVIKTDSKTSAEISIIENIQREDLNFFEQASAIFTLINIYRLTQDEVACRLSVSQSYVANKVRLLKLDESERSKILSYGLTERHARCLLKISDVALRTKAIDYIHDHSLNVTSTEAYVENLLFEINNPKLKTTPRKLVLKDIRIFFNTIDKAVSIVKQAGVGITSERTDDSDGSSTITIRIKNVSCETFCENVTETEIVSCKTQFD